MGETSLPLARNEKAERKTQTNKERNKETKKKTSLTIRAGSEQIAHLVAIDLQHRHLDAVIDLSRLLVTQFEELWGSYPSRVIDQQPPGNTTQFSTQPQHFYSGA